MAEQMKPCPFCGCDDVTAKTLVKGPITRTFVMCNNCGAGIDEIDCDCDPVQLWNTRTEPK